MLESSHDEFKDLINDFKLTDIGMSEVYFVSGVLRRMCNTYLCLFGSDFSNSEFFKLIMGKVFLIVENLLTENMSLKKELQKCKKRSKS